MPLFHRNSAPSAFTKTQQFVYWVLILVGVVLMVAFGAWWFEPEHAPSNFRGLPHLFDFALFALLSFVVWHQLFMDLLLWAMAAKVKRPAHPQAVPGARVAFVTTFVPAKEPIELLEQALKAMVAADYPHDTWVLDEGGDPRVTRLCLRYGAGHFSRHGLARYNAAHGPFATRTKGGNHNAWYHTIGHRYDFVAQIDTDFVPKRNFLTRTLGYFQDPRIAFVGTPQVYGNTDSLIARGAAQQTYGFYGPIIRGFSGHSSSLLIGANHVVRIKALRDIGYYKAHLTEDLLTGMTFHAHKWRSVYVPEILAVGEGPSTWESYFNQQTRWAFGCMDILLRHSRRLFRSMSRSQAMHYFVLQQHYFSGVAIALANLLLMLYFVFGINASALPLLPLAMLYLPLVLWQLLISTWLQRLNVDPEHERGLLLAGRFVAIACWPIYFLAFLGVIRGQHLRYKVTPKGAGDRVSFRLRTFAPHLAFGTVTAASVALSFCNHRQAGIIEFWALANTFLLYSVVVHGAVTTLRRRKPALSPSLMSAPASA
jgi:cellulose synthase (UDP-forming)